MNWIELRALNNLYINGEVKLNDTLAKSGEINYLINSLRILDRTHDKLFTLDGFAELYEKEYLEKYNRYQSFLLENDLLKPQVRFEEYDIMSLFFISNHVDELKRNLSTIRTFSSTIFKGQGSKYLENKPGLKDAVCKILGIADFPEKDPKNLQWRFVVDCIHPKVVVLCENIAHLKNPWKAIEHNIELWYVGGNNIGIIDNISPEKLSKPLYYSCDWDYHGLSIYSRIKEKLRLKSCNISLLLPDKIEDALSVDSPHHYSNWDFNKQFSGLSLIDFTIEEKDIITKLIDKNQWLEEESFDLIKLLTFNRIISDRV